MPPRMSTAAVTTLDTTRDSHSSACTIMPPAESPVSSTCHAAAGGAAVATARNIVQIVPAAAGDSTARCGVAAAPTPVAAARWCVGRGGTDFSLLPGTGHFLFCFAFGHGVVLRRCLAQPWPPYLLGARPAGYAARAALLYQLCCAGLHILGLTQNPSS